MTSTAQTRSASRADAITRAHWLDRMLAQQARLVARLSGIGPLARLSPGRLTRLLQGIGVIALLALGVAVGSTPVWVLLAVPMTVIVLLVLVDAPGLHGRAAAPPRRAPETDAVADHAPPWEHADDSAKIVVRRGAPPRERDPLAGRSG